jgi:hypothetical protein
MTVLPDMPRLSLVAVILSFAVPPVNAEPAIPILGSQQFMEFRQESEDFNRQDPFANAYRAGYYNGYLLGVLDALQGRSVCFRECPCALNTMVGQYLTNHPGMEDRPVTEWLAPLLEEKYPCVQSGSPQATTLVP